MRPCARALETRRAVVDPPTRLLRDPSTGLEKPSTDRSSGQRLRRGQDAPETEQPQAIRAIVWTRRCPVRTPGKKDKPLWAPTFGGPAETKKARSVVASSRVPRLAGFAGSPPAAGLPRTVNWPLVQIPADRHTTTGTCVLGKITIWVNRALAQGFSSARVNNFPSEAAAAGGHAPSTPRSGNDRPPCCSPTTCFSARRWRKPPRVPVTATSELELKRF